MPVVGKDDSLEKQYTQKFRALTSKFGEFIKYDSDRAIVDLGLHITQPSLITKGEEVVSKTKIWFQFKGYHATTLSQKKFDKQKFISYSVRVEDVKFWYASAEPVYFTVYIESIDSFFSEDIREIVDKTYGETILNPSTLGSQKKITLRLEKTSLLTEERLKNMIRHRSLRIDTPSFRGRPLGHRIDPLRSTLREMDSDVFQALVMRLLEEHRYEIEEEIDPVPLFSSSSGDIAKLLYGTMHLTYEWVRQISTQFSSVNSGEFRIEGEPCFAQGKCAVLIHSKKVEEPDLEELKKLVDVISKKHIEHFLVFVNLDLIENWDYIGQVTTAYRETNREPKHEFQGLGEISFTLLVSTLVYLDFRDKISFKLINYLWD
jgi:hypothetical protein